VCYFPQVLADGLDDILDDPLRVRCAGAIDLQQEVIQGYAFEQFLMQDDALSIWIAQDPLLVRVGQAPISALKITHASIGRKRR
jgi:hypothetical protein